MTTVPANFKSFAPGTRVRTRIPGRDGTLYGTVAKTINVDGHRNPWQLVVCWDRLGEGHGWLPEDLVRV